MRNYTEEWLKSLDATGDGDRAEDAKKKIELFQTSPEIIQKHKHTYFQQYEQRMREDPVSALYIKSALELPDGNEKPHITECRINRRNGKYLAL